MDSERFDRLAIGFASAVSRRGLGALAVGAVAALGVAADGEAKKKKKKKKRPPAASPPPPPPPGPTCKAIRKACSFADQDCCDGARCGYNPPCHFQDVCFQEDGGPCVDACDCKGDLLCDERGGNVCSSSCKVPQETCGDDSDCCLNTSTCGANTCGRSGVCCQSVGGVCSASCDCCEPHFCNERTRTCGNCAGLAASCLRNDDCCSDTAICGTDAFERTNRCCEPVGGGCAFNEMCCLGLVCNPFQQKCVAAD